MSDTDLGQKTLLMTRQLKSLGYSLTVQALDGGFELRATKLADSSAYSIAYASDTSAQAAYRAMCDLVKIVTSESAAHAPLQSSVDQAIQVSDSEDSSRRRADSARSKRSRSQITLLILLLATIATLTTYTRTHRMRSAGSISISNPNDFTVKVNVRPRSGNEATSNRFEVAARSDASQTLKGGEYQLYLEYGNEPGNIYQGDDFNIDGTSVEIKLVTITGGNYHIRRSN